MKLLLKNLKQEKFTVDVEPSDTVEFAASWTGIVLTYVIIRSRR